MVNRHSARERRGRNSISDIYHQFQNNELGLYVKFVMRRIDKKEQKKALEKPSTDGKSNVTGFTRILLQL